MVLSSKLLFLVALACVEISQCGPLPPQQVLGTYPEFPISLTDGNGFGVINQSNPVYLILSSNSYPTSAIASSQGVFSTNHGSNQFVQTSIPISGAPGASGGSGAAWASGLSGAAGASGLSGAAGASGLSEAAGASGLSGAPGAPGGSSFAESMIYSSPSTTFGWGAQNSGALQSAVSLSPFLQSIKQDLHSLPNMFQSNSVGGGLVKNSNALGLTNTNAVQTTVQYPGITSSSYQQYFAKPAVPSTVGTSNNDRDTSSGSSAISAHAFGNSQNKGTFVTLPTPSYNYGLLGTGSDLKNYGALTSGLSGGAGGVAGSIDNVASTTLQTPGIQTQIVQIPCTLNIPSPVPISVNPGISQISTYLPTQQQQANYLIPSSFIDHSPPTIAILRPPVSAIESENLAVAAPAFNIVAQQASSSQPTNAFIIDSTITDSSLATTINEQAKQKARQQDSRGVPIQNDDEQVSEIKSEFAPGLAARHALPIVYTMLPPLSSPPIVSGAASALETSSRGKKKNSSKPQQQQEPTRGTNPFFNVNKRKHFEFYQYF